MTSSPRKSVPSVSQIVDELSGLVDLLDKQRVTIARAEDLAEVRKDAVRAFEQVRKALEQVSKDLNRVSVQARRSKPVTDGEPKPNDPLKIALMLRGTTNAG
jgi:methyl-accepting chemotaxis protein